MEDPDLKESSSTQPICNGAKRHCQFPGVRPQHLFVASPQTVQIRSETAPFFFLRGDEATALFFVHGRQSAYLFLQFGDSSPRFRDFSGSAPPFFFERLLSLGQLFFQGSGS